MNLVPVAPHGLLAGQNEEHRLQEAFKTLPGPSSIPNGTQHKQIRNMFLLKSSSNRALKQGTMRTCIWRYNARGGMGQAARGTSRCP